MDPKLIPLKDVVSILNPGIRDSKRNIDPKTNIAPTKNNVKKFTLIVKKDKNGFAIIIAKDNIIKVARTYAKLVGNTIPANEDITK
jgi:hypothetical protein